MRRMYLLAALALASCQAEAPPLEAQQAESGVPAIIATAQPSVVLLLTERADGSTHYGAGVVVSEHGHALTNLHVVDDSSALSALLYDPDRASYSALDGGLSRFVFENATQAVPARLLRSDPILDLAVVQVVRDGTTPLPVRTEPLVVGETVYALGHPQESPWSFTAGVVSAMHQGLVQHDAAINEGSSGGPLIDTAGRLVGVNTSKLLGSAEGIAFARPVSLVMPMLDEASEPLAIDRSTPEKAAVSCEHALEFSPSASGECWDYAYEHGMLMASLPRAFELAGLEPEQVALVRRAMEAAPAEAYVTHSHACFVAYMNGEHEDHLLPHQVDLDGLWASDAARKAHVEAKGLKTSLRDEILANLAVQEDFVNTLESRFNIKTDFTHDPDLYRRFRKLGIRIERAHRPDDRLALLHVAGRNFDESEYGYVECWVRHDDGWKQRLYCGEEGLSHLPEGWPPPFGDVRWKIRGLAVHMAMELTGLRKSDLGIEAVASQEPTPDADATSVEVSGPTSGTLSDEGS